MRKKPNPGLVAPRAGGRAKWPSHFGRDQGSCLLDVQPPEKVAGYQRFTRPSRDVVIISKRDPRRSTTVVLDAPHPMPVGPNTTSGLDTSKRTPASPGPTQRTSGVQARPSQRSILSESTATTSRARVPRMIATWRGTAPPGVTLAASASTASQSTTPPSPGSAMAGTTPAAAPAVDPQRINGDDEPGPRPAHDRDMAGDGQAGSHLGRLGIHRQPVQHAAEPGQRDGGHDRGRGQGDDELEEREAAPHSPELASRGPSRRHRTTAVRRKKTRGRAV